MRVFVPFPPLCFKSPGMCRHTNRRREERWLTENVKTQALSFCSAVGKQSFVLSSDRRFYHASHLCPSVWLSIHPSIHLGLSIYLHVHLSIHLYVNLSISIFMSTCLSIHLSVHICEMYPTVCHFSIIYTVIVLLLK